MLLSIRTRGEAIPEKARRYAERKGAKIERYFNDVQTMELVVGQERGEFVAELTIQGDGTLLRSQERSGDLHAAIDNAATKLERQALRQKARVRDEHRKSAAASALASDETALETGEELRPVIVRRKRYMMKPMPPEEAAWQMELIGHDFYMFRNDETGEINTLYRRHDGDYGLIEPEP